MQRSTGLVCLVAVVLVVVSGGCATQSELIASQEAEIDSMQTEIHRLEEQLSVLRDSLQFYDDIDSGQYYRDRRQLLLEIDRLKYELGVAGDGGRTVDLLRVDSLFEPASANLTEAGRARLDRLADVLSTYTEHRIRVEAHSDSTPIGAGLKDVYPSNWELSAARASAVVRYLVEVKGFREDRIEVASRGSTMPIAPNNTAAGRSENRRIRIAVLESP